MENNLSLFKLHFLKQECNIFNQTQDKEKHNTTIVQIKTDQVCRVSHVFPDDEHLWFFF